MSDLISREEALNVLLNKIRDVTGTSFEKDRSGLCIAYYLVSKEIPSADRPSGEWIDWLGKGNEWECSICKCSIESHGSIAYKYCPMCGARMKGGVDE